MAKILYWLCQLGILLVSLIIISLYFWLVRKIYARCQPQEFEPSPIAGYNWPDSVARSIWRNKWRWAVGERWSAHALHMGFFLTIVSYIMWLDTTYGYVRRLPSISPEWILWINPWIRLLLALESIALTLLPLVVSFFVATMHFLLETVVKVDEKVHTLFGRESSMKRFLDERYSWIIVNDLTPRGGYPVWFLFMLWPIALYQWCVAGILCIGGAVFYALGWLLRIFAPPHD
jgi:hypothetical protein